MPNYKVINAAEHKDMRVITSRAAELGDAVMYAATFPFEFRTVQATYPILFQQDSEGGFYPVALFGFQEGENLFLSEAGWAANYVPAMLRREPFLIGSEQRDGEAVRVMSIDVDHPRVNQREGEPLFDPAGGRTQFLENMANMLEALYHGNEHAGAFVAAMQAHDLIETINMEIVLKDGSRNHLLGFSALDEEKVQQLSADVLGELNADGFLMPMFMMLASIANVQKLVDLKNERLGNDSPF